MAASYPSAVKNFGMAVTAGDGILAAHVNTLREEVVAVETALGVNAGTWADWTPTITWSGGTTDPTSYTIVNAKYTTFGEICFFNFVITIVVGSGNRDRINVTPPNTLANNANFAGRSSVVGGVTQPAVGLASQGAAMLIVYLPAAMSSDGSISGTGIYQIA